MHAHQNPSPHLLWKVVEGNLFCIWLSADIQGVGVGVGWGTKMAKLSCCLVRGPGLFICPLPYCGYLPPSLSWNDFHLFPQENMYKAQRSQLLAFWSTKLKVPRSQKLNFPRLGEADKDLRPIKYPRSFWSLVLPPPSPGWVLGWRSWKIIETPCHSGILEQRDSCILSWGEPGEAFGVPCSPHGRGTEEMAAWFPWAAGHSSATLEQHQEPTHPSCGEAGWGSPGGEARSRPQEWPSETFSTGDCRPAGAKPSRCWLCYSPDSSSPAPGPGAFVTHHPGTETNPQEKVAFLAGDKGE